MIGFIDTYTFTQFETTGSTALSLFCTLSSLPLHTHAHAHALSLFLSLSLGFCVFTSRILVRDLSQSHYNFKSHLKCSWHCLIPFLPFLQLPIPVLLSTTVVYSAVLRLLLLLSCQTLLVTTLHRPRTGNTVFLLLHACLLGFPHDRYPASSLARWLLSAAVTAWTQRERHSYCCLFV
jgi:hypothetical protein